MGKFMFDEKVHPSTGVAEKYNHGRSPGVKRVANANVHVTAYSEPKAPGHRIKSNNKPGRLGDRGRI